MFWSRSRIALVACAAASGLAMLYVGLFQVHWIGGLACPGFGVGCESVALAPFAWPLGFADGLLLAALAGIVAAVAQVRGREAGAALVGLGFLDVLASLLVLLQMQRFHAFDLWHTLAALLSLPIAALAVRCSRAAAVAPDDRAQQQQ